MKKLSFAVATMALLLGACTQQSALTKSGLSPEKFVAEVDGKPTALYTLTNNAGMEVCITNFGGRIVSIMVPDRNGVMQDVVLGFDNINDYVTIPSDFGAAIGRYGNRINQGRITLDGKEYQLSQNNYGHCLHGGEKGWQYQVYEARQLDNQTLELVMRSPDGDNGFPGNVEAKVTYTLTDDNAIVLAYEATTDAPTVINLTNHSYFNLSGNPAKSVLDHMLTVSADGFTPVDATFMTTGEIAAVEGTPMDFRTATAIGARMHIDDEQLRNGNGYDHNWVLNTGCDPEKTALYMVSPESGISLSIRTNEPGIQIYSGNFLDGTVKGKGGIVYNCRAGICLETQHYPDSPNKPQWPSPVLRPGEKYESLCIFTFGVEK
ncbi:MAG: galactose mutarotase [Coprobacter sp.]|nr:galactose mutarotase [Coprobacter sp.]